MQGTKVFIKRN